MRQFNEWDLLLFDSFCCHLDIGRNIPWKAIHSWGGNELSRDNVEDPTPEGTHIQNIKSVTKILAMVHEHRHCCGFRSHDIHYMDTCFHIAERFWNTIGIHSDSRRGNARIIHIHTLCLRIDSAGNRFGGPPVLTRCAGTWIEDLNKVNWMCMF